jgi:hypothetical protein
VPSAKRFSAGSRGTTAVEEHLETKSVYIELTGEVSNPVRSG